MFAVKIKVFGKTLEIPVDMYTKYKDLFGEPSSEELEDILLASDASCKNYEKSALQELLIKELSWSANIKPLTAEEKRVAIQRWVIMKNNNRDYLNRSKDTR